MTAINFTLPDGAKPRKVKARTAAPAVDELSRAIDALHSIPADVDRDTWVRVGMAAHAAGIGFDTFDQWSAGAESYDQRSARDTWRSFKDGNGGVSAGTLHYMAAQYGGGYARQQATPRQPVVAPAPARKMDASEIWNRCEAVGHHDYITSKMAEGVPLDGLRVVPAGDSLHIMGTSMAGALVVPVRGADGTLASLQFIPPQPARERLKAEGKPGKLNLPGCSMDGWHVVGELVPGRVAYVCEGIGQAWACWQATGRAAVVAFGWGRVKTVAAALLKLHSDTPLALVPDAGKEADAANIALALGVQCVELPEGLPNNFDVSDLAARHGLDELAMLLEQAKPESASLPWGARSAADFGDEFEPPDELVEDFITTGASSIVYGDSNSGKTFLMVDLACAVARGIEWLGKYQVEQGLVIYLAVENPASVKSRVQAYQVRHQCKVADFYWVPKPVNLLTDNMDDVVLAIRQIERHAGGKKVKLIIGDTLKRMSAGGEENSGQDMGLVVSNMDYIRAETGAHFMLIHHSGKDTSKGARGHSSLRAAVDTEVEVTVDADDVTRCAEITKQRDLGSKGARIGFKLEVLELGTTKWGKPATSCVVAPMDAPATKTEKKKDGKLASHIKTFTNAWFGSGVEERNSAPYISRSALKQYLVTGMGLTESTAETYVKPSASGKLVHDLVQACVIAHLEPGYIVTDDALASSLLMMAKNGT